MSVIMPLQFACILVVILVAPVQGSVDNPRLETLFKGCQKKTGTNDADFELIKMRKVPLTEEGICMVECLFNKMHIIENGQFNKRGFVITFSSIAKGDMKKLSGLKKIATICDEEITNAGFQKGCDTTKMVLDCFAKNKDILDFSKKHSA